jgi:hypothetical protein
MLDHGLCGLHAVLVVFAEPPFATELCECTPHDPGQTGGLEGTLFPFDNVHFPAVALHELPCQLTALVPGIGDYCPDPWKQGAQSTEQPSSPTHWTAPTGMRSEFQTCRPEYGACVPSRVCGHQIPECRHALSRNSSSSATPLAMGRQCRTRSLSSKQFVEHAGAGESAAR